MPIVQVTEARHLDPLHTVVHEGFFEVGDVRFDREQSMVLLPFRRCERDEARIVAKTRWKTTWEAPWHRYVLRIAAAVECEVADTAETGGFWLEELTYDRDTGTIRIEGTPPANIAVRVNRLLIHLDDTHEVIGLGRYETGRGGRWETGPAEVLPLP